MHRVKISRRWVPHGPEDLNLVRRRAARGLLGFRVRKLNQSNDFQEFWIRDGRAPKLPFNVSNIMGYSKHVEIASDAHQTVCMSGLSNGLPFDVP